MLDTPLKEDEILTADELREFEAGREAQRQGKDFFQNPHMKDDGQTGLLIAWANGHLTELTADYIKSDHGQRLEARG